MIEFGNFEYENMELVVELRKMGVIVMKLKGFS